MLAQLQDATRFRGAFCWRAQAANCVGIRYHDAQVHFPLPTFPQKVLAEAMAQALEEGLISAVGVCNYNGDQMGKLHAELAKLGLPLVSNQV